MRMIEGVYVLTYKSRIIYIGESVNIPARIGKHLQQKEKKFDAWHEFPCRNRKIVERLLIRRYTPKYNVQCNISEPRGATLFNAEEIKRYIRDINYAKNHGIETLSARQVKYDVEEYKSELSKARWRRCDEKKNASHLDEETLKRLNREAAMKLAIIFAKAG